MSEEILSIKKEVASILLIEERSNKNIVIGAPHHAPGGEKDMPCPEHTDADENTGFIARRIAEQINASSIIACNYRIDPNKNLKTDYALQVSQWIPAFLIEIHGHGAKKNENPRKPDDMTIEISSGSIEKNKVSMHFAQMLKQRFAVVEELKAYTIDGDISKIYFTAKNTATITDNRWASLHIELPPSLRLGSDNKLPAVADSLIRALVETINEFCIKSMSS
jgi:hypothetical protein